MQTNKWGSETWLSLHCITFNAPNNITIEKQKTYYNYFSLLRELLPCKYCRLSYRVFFKFVPIQDYIDCKMGLTYWLYTIHNLVNLKLGKYIVSFINVVQTYEDMKAQNVPKITDIQLFVEKTEQKYSSKTASHLKTLENVIKRENFNYENICKKYRL